MLQLKTHQQKQHWDIFKSGFEAFMEGEKKLSCMSLFDYWNYLFWRILAIALVQDMHETFFYAYEIRVTSYQAKVEIIS